MSHDCPSPRTIAKADQALEDLLGWLGRVSQERRVELMHDLARLCEDADDDLKRIGMLAGYGMTNLILIEADRARQAQDEREREG